MSAGTFDLVKDIFLLLFFFAGTVWMWNLIRLPANYQKNLENVFKRSRYRFKWLFLIGFIVLAVLFVWQEILKR